MISQAGGGDDAYFHPIANPQAGSRNLVEKAEKEPATGNTTASSPRAWTVQYSITPMNVYAIKTDAGPPRKSALPEATNRPVPGVDHAMLATEKANIIDAASGRRMGGCAPHKGKTFNGEQLDSSSKENQD